MMDGSCWIGLCSRPTLVTDRRRLYTLTLLGDLGMDFHATQAALSLLCSKKDTIFCFVKISQLLSLSIACNM